MRIKLTSIMVDDQAKALRFYTEVFGFVAKHDIPVGEYRWLTVVSPEGADASSCRSSPTPTRPGARFRTPCSRRASRWPRSK